MSISPRRCRKNKKRLKWLHPQSSNLRHVRKPLYVDQKTHSKKSLVPTWMIISLRRATIWLKNLIFGKTAADQRTCTRKSGCVCNGVNTFFCLRPRKLRSSRRLLSYEGVQPHGPARHARKSACSLSMHVVHALIRTSCLAASRRARGGVATRGRPLL